MAKLLAPTAEERAMAATMASFTPEYASPEQIRGEPASTATDVYSLGLLLRELLEPERTERLPVDLQSIIAKAISEHPQDRYSSAEQLSADLERYLEGQPILARRQTFGYRAWKFIRRHQAAMATGLAVAIGLVFTTGWALGKRISHGSSTSAPSAVSTMFVPLRTRFCLRFTTPFKTFQGSRLPAS